MHQLWRGIPFCDFLPWDLRQDLAVPGGMGRNFSFRSGKKCLPMTADKRHNKGINRLAIRIAKFAAHRARDLPDLLNGRQVPAARSASIHDCAALV